MNKFSKKGFWIVTSYVCIITIFLLASCVKNEKTGSEGDSVVRMSKEKLRNKIKGAWAAQTIGVTFGRPYEFKYNSTMIQDNQKLVWNDSSMFVEFRDRPGTYDDIYIDLTFMKVIQEHGIDAPVDKFAKAFAQADYKLWFANQTARYNILNGLEPPQSGHWLNNPCADDIDFQIEADFAGLMNPGMINSAIAVCDKVGHIMNYGDGYYGGVYVASLYALALVSDDAQDIEFIAREALKAIPKESTFAQCINDVIQWYQQEPDDWKSTWYKVNRKWATEVGSPLGVFQPFNIDAKINAAWVMMGLLYGKGDFTRTFEIATRCGDDADCNPATAGGILAAIVGFDNIPDFWKQGLEKIEGTPFMGTTISLLDAYEISYTQAEEMILRNGGKVNDTELLIPYQRPQTIPLEISFEGHYPVAIVQPVVTRDEITFEFEGIGFALAGPSNIRDLGEKNHVFETEMYIDGQLVEKAKLPTITNQRRFTPFWRYQLPKGVHKVRIVILNPVDYAEIEIKYAIIYDNQPVDIKF